jgi:hypothetical protein
MTAGAELASARRRARAEFILREARELGIRVGARDADDIVMLAPLRVPYDVRRQFERAIYEYRDEVVEIIERENGGGLS